VPENVALIEEKRNIYRNLMRTLKKRSLEDREDTIKIYIRGI
jgi:hypothetical protein